MKSINGLVAEAKAACRGVHERRASRERARRWVLGTLAS